ncbi:hypothetical protein LCD36_01770 [Saccharopolyspora sp. 6T]|uniref:hypothetical protein n=1 Tax=Saccharopolyspora sp. 6T TaxID=2877238 RepID=UPI001CD40E0D|nr:hypothetical protein [Saccharopolyspora sp. 6T]MCA1185173.1 hypothetical protein [Saccharopolyspora sp. 6T]
MVRHASRSLCGRERELRLVREFLVRPERGGIPVSRPVPVLVFCGTSGTGKTALLDELAARMDGNVPCARLDCARIDGSPVPRVLADLAAQLSRPCKGYGMLEFPRFIAGHLALGPRLDPTSRPAARRQVEESLATYPKISDPPGFLASLAGGTAAAVGGNLPDLVLSGINALRRARWQWGDERAWYGHQDRGLDRDPVDVLVDLNRKARADVPDVAQEVGEVLWAAFLADLRNGFRSGWTADRRTLNCAVLLDDADAVPELLRGLEAARRRRGTAAAEDPDPLTAVATAHVDPLARGGPVPIDGAGYADHLARSVQHRRHGSYPVLLGDLSADAVADMAAPLSPVLDNSRRAVAMLHGFAHGHARTTRMLLDAIAEQGADPADLHGLLVGPLTAGAGADRVESLALKAFLRGIPLTGLEDLITCSAARNFAEGQLLAEYRPMLASADPRPVVLEAAWWPCSVDADQVMVPVLRRLLLRRLAARGPGERADWESVHRWLRSRCEQDQDLAGELHFALALGEVEQVTRRLADQLDQMDAVAWLALLGSVCSAPSRSTSAQAPGERVRDLTRWVMPRDLPVAPLARLVAAKWVAADPLGGARKHELNSEIAVDLDDVAPYARDGLPVLRAEADRYR